MQDVGNPKDLFSLISEFLYKASPKLSAVTWKHVHSAADLLGIKGTQCCFGQAFAFRYSPKQNVLLSSPCQEQSSNLESG